MKKVLEVALFAGALVSGIVAMGCWTLTQADATITPAEGPTVLFIMVAGTVTFFGLLVGAGYVRSKRENGRSPLVEFLFRFGICGAAVILFFAAFSRGMVFRFDALLILLLLAFLAFVAAFWPRSVNSQPRRLT